jgi:hypothetical protein
VKLCPMGSVKWWLTDSAFLFNVLKLAKVIA